MALGLGGGAGAELTGFAVGDGAFFAGGSGGGKSGGESTLAPKSKFANAGGGGSNAMVTSG